MSSGRGGTRWSYCVRGISGGSSQWVTCAQTWQGWTYSGKPGSQHHNITLHSYLQGPESNYFPCNQRSDSVIAYLNAVTALMAPLFFLRSYYLVMLHPGWGRAREFSQPGSPEAACFRFYSGAYWKRPKPADKWPSGSVTEWCITAPLGRLTRIGSFCSDLDLDFQMLSVGSLSWRWMICSQQLQWPEP